MLHELWFALRRLRARPWHTAVVVGILAVGCGAALTVFRLADAILLRALPYRDADRLVHVSMQIPLAPNKDLPFSDVSYRLLEQGNRSFDGVASYRTVGVNLTAGTTPERVTSARVTGNFFDVLGIAPQLGRGFRTHEETEKGPVLIVLSDALWRSSFGGDRAVIGRVVRVNGGPATIVGVADARLAFPAADVGFYTLMDLDANGTRPFDLGIEALARLRSGVSLDAAAKDASRMVQQFARTNPGPHAKPSSDFSGYRAALNPIRDDIVGGVKPTIALLTAAVLFVLALTCVNVATLELVRSSARRTELAVRAALGADRGRLVLGAFAEGVVQATIGGVLGLLLSAAAVRVLAALLPASFGRGMSGGFSLGLVAALAATILLCAIASGAFPIAATLGADLQSVLRDRDAASGRRVAWVRRGLIVLQIAFACVLVYGAALMIATVRETQRVALGFRPEGLIVFQLNLPDETYRGADDVRGAFFSLADRLREIPGVTSVALTNSIPLGPFYNDALVGVEGREFKADGTDPSVDYRVVSAEYFATMGIGLVSGRAFRPGDPFLDGTPVVISKRMAALVWPDGADPIGRRIRTGPYAPWMSVIGVVGDAKNRSATQPSRAELYLPFGAPRSPIGVSRAMTFVVRATGSVNAIQSATQRIVAQANPDLPLYGMKRYEDVVAASQIREVTTMRTLTVFAAIALALAIAGTYAMLMFAVVQRRREMALRHAVGASPFDLSAMIVSETAQLMLAGIVAGIGGAMLLSRLLSGFLYGVTSFDARIVLVTLGIVGLAGLAATMLPARRAGSVDPMLVLRGE